MKTINIHAALTLFAVTAGFALGCSNNDNPNPSNPSNAAGTTSTGGSAAAGDTGGSAANADTGGSTSVTTSTGGESNGGSSAGGATNGGTTGVTGTGGATVACVLDTSPGKNCYPTCTPSKNEEFLNQCTTASCQKFDNTSHNVPSPVPAVP